MVLKGDESASSHSFSVSLKTGAPVAEIRIRSEQGKQHQIEAELKNEYLNMYEQGKAGRIMSGVVHTYIQPFVRLQLRNTNPVRTVLEIHKPADEAKSSSALLSSNWDREEVHKYLLDFDYPLTVFLSFSIACALEFVRLGHARF